VSDWKYTGEAENEEPLDQIEWYLRWVAEGHLNSTVHCFDLGNTVSNALRTFEKSGHPFAGSTDPATAGNGSLMRLAPVPLAYACDPGAGHPSGGRKLANHPRRTTAMPFRTGSWPK
jgi:hypothetical protein